MIRKTFGIYPDTGNLTKAKLIYTLQSDLGLDIGWMIAKSMKGDSCIRNVGSHCPEINDFTPQEYSA